MKTVTEILLGAGYLLFGRVMLGLYQVGVAGRKWGRK
jgi:hypothetical protein